MPTGRAIDGTKFVLTHEWEYDPPSPTLMTGGGLVLAAKGARTWFASRGSNARYNDGHGEHQHDIMRLLSRSMVCLERGWNDYSDFFNALTAAYGASVEVDVRYGISDTDYLAVMTPQIWQELGHKGVPTAGAASAAHWIQWESGEVWEVTVERWPLCECDQCLATKVVDVARRRDIYGPESGALHLGRELLAEVINDYNETLKESPWASSRT